MTFTDLTLDVEQHIEIKADIGDVYKSALYRLGEGNQRPDGEPLNLILEQWPGGRWFRDRGNGVGHLWGHVQVIKPPTLIEISGPLFMSYPAINHLEMKLEKVSAGTKLTFRHRAIGLLDPTHKRGVSEGWKYLLDNITKDVATAESNVG